LIKVQINSIRFKVGRNSNYQFQSNQSDAESNTSCSILLVVLVVSLDGFCDQLLQQRLVGRLGHRILLLGPRSARLDDQLLASFAVVVLLFLSDA